jgi:plastocyanin
VKKDVATIGLILVFVAALLFYIVFSGGKLEGLTVTGSSSIANFVAFLYVIIGLPVGSGLAYFGLAFKPRLYAAGGQPPIIYKSSSALAGAAIAVGIIALIIGFAAIGISFSGIGQSASSGAVTSLSSEVASLNSKVSSLNSELSVVNATPAVVGIKMQWCTQSILQDRFCPGNIIVDQGDIVQVLFMQNDTAAHTFTLDTAPYFFQINASGAGELNFLTNYSPIAGNCSNSGTYAQMAAGISETYCVSGSSLLSQSTLQSHGAYDYVIGQNPNPGLPFTPNSGEIVSGEPAGVNFTNPGAEVLQVNDQVQMVAMNVTGVGVSAFCGAVCETQGIGAFWATTPGVYEFFCHYHVSNGMFGYLVVLPNVYCENNPTACGQSP